MKFDELTPANQSRAQHMFIGARSDDGYDYELGIDGQILYRKKVISKGTISVNGSTPITIGGVEDHIKVIEAQNQIYIDALQAIIKHLELIGGNGPIKPTTLVIAERALEKAFNVHYDYTTNPPTLTIPK